MGFGEQLEPLLASLQDAVPWKSWVRCCRRLTPQAPANRFEPSGFTGYPSLVLTTSPCLGLLLVPFVRFAHFATFCKKSGTQRLSLSAGNSLLGLPHSVEPRMVCPYRARLLFYWAKPRALPLGYLGLHRWCEDKNPRLRSNSSRCSSV
jgi:hypothetical protein